MTPIPSAEDVHKAAGRIAGLVAKTPLLRCAKLDEITGGQVFLKAECLQNTGSFKIRGAMNHFAKMSPKDRAKGVVAWSSGNHAQGVAAAAKRFRSAAKIVMPADAPHAKIETTAALGAEIIFYDRARENREEIGRRIAAEEGRIIIPPYDHADTICGQGTVGLEAIAQAEASKVRLDDVLVPVSGGGLAAGIGLVMKDHFPSIQLYAVEPAGFDDHCRSLISGQLQTNTTATAGSLCDALLAPTPGVLTWRLNRTQMAGGYTVPDDNVLTAMAFAHRHLGLRLEPGGVIALAAVLSGRHSAQGRNVCVILSGGNVDDDTFNRALDHQLDVI